MNYSVVTDVGRMYVMDPACLEHELPKGPDRFMATRRCLSIRLVAREIARVSLSNEPVPDFLPPPTFEAILETPSRRVLMADEALEPLVELRVRSASTLLRLWSDREPRPKDVLVILTKAPRAH